MLPFDPGPCRAAIPVYAFVDGACAQQIYGGCDGNDNRFDTLEECMGTCGGPPDPGACPPNRVAREICLACGPAGGCSKRATVCALVCDADAGSVRVRRAFAPGLLRGRLPVRLLPLTPYAL